MKELTIEQVREFGNKFLKDSHNKAYMNAITSAGILKVSKVFSDSYKTKMTFSKEIKTSKVTAQNSSGRCWLFAGLNLFRHEIEKKLDIKEFELSQSYLMFYDKLEKANYFLESILDTLELETSSRTIYHLLTHIVDDGGQWDMFSNLVKKYGVIPKDVMPESFHSSNSRMMNKLLVLKLREFAYELREKYKKDIQMEELRNEKMKMVQTIYDMLCKFLSKPIDTFDFEYTNKDGKYHITENMDSLQFFKKVVDINLDDYVSVINAPTIDKPFNRVYTVKYLGNVYEGEKIKYLNVNIDTMKQLTKKQLLDDEPTWFGCDVGQMSNSEDGVMSMGVYDFELSLKIPFTMSKATRLDYAESVLTHAMVFTGVNICPDGTTDRWKVENSWGDKRGKKGYFMMTDEWFDEFMYEVAIHKKHLTKDLLDVLKEKLVVLDPWDPMGSLAK
ncbi:MAG: C1 family peptidase [Clostridiales bacterium]|nr:C1 family peptidase [Clostridiales bacterium]